MNTRLEPLSIWIDNQLQRVLHLCPAYLKDSWHMLHILRTSPNMPPDSIILTADAKAMCANIPTQHALEAIEKWMELHKHELPPDFPVRLILKGLEIVMTQNALMCGNCFCLQLNGTAMGTSCACAYATICCSYHEETKLLNLTILLLHKRLTDDALAAIKNVRGSHNDFMTAMNSFGPEGQRLEWEPQGVGRDAVFLDLRIRINWRGEFITSTYQKDMNLYPYRKPTSAQSPQVHYGFVYGSLHRFLWQNTYESDFLRLVKLTVERLFAREHSLDTLSTNFSKAARKVITSSPAVPKLGPKDHAGNELKDAIIIHLPYHPQDPVRREVQQLFRENLLPALEDNSEGGLKRAIIAHSNLPTIGSYVKKNRLEGNVDTTKGST